ncbi:hypothetical protein K493DRAFT_93758 [Basidiobolus meristosporus CBS 931.73]|uniref:Cytochrome b561 domain-containing protein n=1 Tax=Basidiobolus meristosporus CBS 931.73 TaxID=1314790 RepID=A0A1Y1X786_9FUNG|nr:hypothetical protein K493DRAFT_93758 [Basidiobolus meristosporus CBS 931.73]|eukprot:ORX81629.1 hypothetical protein K493DRAFT_93758 [Basidiobolus meristosporus CBS 931.73]
MAASCGFMFPTGVIMGLIRSRWHVPVQLAGAGIATFGLALGFMPGMGSPRTHSLSSLHTNIARVLILAFALHGFCGLYIEFYKTTPNFQQVVTNIHKWLGISTSILAYVQMALGSLIYRGVYAKEELEQGSAHFKASFLVTGAILLLIIRAGNAYMQSLGKSQEYWDSWVMTLWGIFNTFTEHRWGESWSHGDLQHTSLGLVWWFGGMLGLYMTRPNGKSHSILPALVILFTGAAMEMDSVLHETSKLHRILYHICWSVGVDQLFSAVMPKGDFQETRVKEQLQTTSIFFLLLLGWLAFNGVNDIRKPKSSGFFDVLVLAFIFFSMILYPLMFVSVLQKTIPLHLSN